MAAMVFIGIIGGLIGLVVAIISGWSVLGVFISYIVGGILAVIWLIVFRAIFRNFAPSSGKGAAKIKAGKKKGHQISDL
ncbi:hypothetical protein [uncultured Tateyamaria sp.]|uniref:hypothetical protein n=1 Tax=uncultured Tateyamaria sp. TaxID=455651 RepID=UPI0026217B5F|nr:hypothetical protein [uncultured Tateyamaria sp.]